MKFRTVCVKMSNKEAILELDNVIMRQIIMRKCQVKATSCPLTLLIALAISLASKDPHCPSSPPTVGDQPNARK